MNYVLMIVHNNIIKYGTIKVNVINVHNINIL